MPPWTTNCEICGRVVANPQDPWTQFTEGVAKPVAESLRRLLAAEPPWAPWMPSSPTMPSMGMFGRASHHHRRHGGCECCDPCTSDPCHCRCCIDDADLAVYTRVGERRVVPVLLTNHWRRERQITLELSEFTSRGGSKPVEVHAEIQPQTSFTLGPCQEHEVFLVVETAAPPTGTAAPPGTTEGQPPARTPDVDGCTVLYGELRVGGCDTRSTRIALALLPRDCAPFRVKCQCGCC